MQPVLENQVPAAVSRGRTVTFSAEKGHRSSQEATSRSFHEIMGEEPSNERRLAPIATAESIRAWVHTAIFEPSPERPYKINYPPADRPVRIYADGVYDLFHYAYVPSLFTYMSSHALQLRQAKLSFPSVHLIVGVVSSELCATHKNRPMLDSCERYEAVRNCRWVDEVLEDAPWVINQELIDRLEIDYVAHDELPYAMAAGGEASADVYDWLKKAGKFLPTRRTEGVSTSDLVARIVTMYREGELDGKLVKIGEANLASTAH
ncbi:choline-phosphate cytidylyltransferase [Malassezia pachydermatis]